MIAEILSSSLFIPWVCQKILLWIQAQWTIASFHLNSWTQQHRRILSIFQFLDIPSMVSWEWWTQSTTVYMKISAKHALFYIGSTEYNVFHREQTRVRKYRQLETDRLAYFEPALKLWHHFQDFHEFAIFPVKHCDVHQLQSEESSLQYVLRPEYNSPWINPRLKKARVGKQLYGPTAANPYIHSSAKWVRRYRVRPTQLQSDLMVTRFQFVSQRFKLLYLLGSDSLLKFETSKFLRSNQVDTWFCFALFRYAKHIAEPFRTRAKSQRKLILQFRHSDAPPNNIPIRLRVVNDEMAFNVRKWLLGMTYQYRAQFPPLHKVRAPLVFVKGRTLGTFCYNFRQKLKFWHPDQQPTCSCSRFPQVVQQQQRHTTHISCMASEAGKETPFQANMNDELAPSKKKFLTHNTVEFEKFLQRWKLPSNLMQYWQAMLIQEFEELLRQESSTSTWTVAMIYRTCSSLSCHVTSPADHFPSTLTLHCPAQWHELLKKTFLDTKIFRQCVQPSNQVLKNIQYSLPEWIKNTYSWGLDFKNSRLSTGSFYPNLHDSGKRPGRL